jgi:dihydrofolate reductase
VRKSAATAAPAEVHNDGPQQCLNAGLIDEFTIHIAPVVFGAGIRLFDNLARSRFAVEVVDAAHSDPVVHVHCKVTNR